MIISVQYKQPVDGFYQYEVDYKNFFNKMKETRTFFFFFSFCFINKSQQNFI